ncbi:MAG TPA: hypothetical protein VK348_00490, partial [Planctomycetota bacterium]|nr:hypothetical protein [Planctomycetota bacterium]
LGGGRVVAPIDVLVHMDRLAPDDLAAWRRGKVPYLERVLRGNLTRHSRLLRILRFQAHDLDLAPSITVYTRHGKGRGNDSASPRPATPGSRWPTRRTSSGSGRRRSTRLRRRRP